MGLTILNMVGEGAGKHKIPQQNTEEAEQTREQATNKEQDGSSNTPTCQKDQSNMESSPQIPGEVVNRTITSPVRSGQRIVVPNGDLTITASVGSGAEVIASGNIHVYGTLRGRAIAGSNGDENAMIFCKKLDADLISIAGIYLVSEDIARQKHSTPVQVTLHGESLIITES